MIGNTGVNTGWPLAYRAPTCLLDGAKWIASRPQSDTLIDDSIVRIDREIK